VTLGHINKRKKPRMVSAHVTPFVLIGYSLTFCLLPAITILFFKPRFIANSLLKRTIAATVTSWLAVNIFRAIELPLAISARRQVGDHQINGENGSFALMLLGWFPGLVIASGIAAIIYIRHKRQTTRQEHDLEPEYVSIECPRKRRMYTIAESVLLAFLVYFGSYLILSINGRYEPGEINIRTNEIEMYYWAPYGFVTDYRVSMILNYAYMLPIRLDYHFWHHHQLAVNMHHGYNCYPVNPVARYEVDKVIRVWRQQ